MSEKDLQSGALFVYLYILSGELCVNNPLLQLFLFEQFLDFVISRLQKLEFQLMNHVQSRVLWVGYISCESNKFVFFVRHNVN